MNTLLESQTSSSKGSKTFRILFVPTTVSGVSFLRMGVFAWQMRKHPNISTVMPFYRHAETVQNPWQVDMLSNPTIAQHLDYLCGMADIVVWQALDFTHSLELFEELRAKHQKPFLTEMDDFLGDVPPENEAFASLGPGSLRFKVMMEQMRQSDAIICSTPYLKEMYSQEFENIHVIPNSVEFKGYPGRRKIVGWDTVSPKKHKGVRIGWIGGGGHTADLEMVAPVLKDLLEKYEDVKFYCIHGCPNIYKSWQKVYHTLGWAPINIYPRFMASFGFDIGIAPLVDNNFNRGKSNLRWLEYSALKIPTVASPLPDFKRVIKHGETGFLAESLDDWGKHLGELIENEGYRHEIGQKAYKQIKDDFNARKTANLYLRTLKEIAL